MSIRRRTALGLAVSAAAGPALAAFRDPLQTPALQARRLAQAPMTALARPAAQRIVAAGWRGVVLVSTDGGSSWTQAEVPVGIDLTALAFTSEQNGWATGSDGVLLQTRDGGMTWSKRADGHTAARAMLDRYQAASAAQPADKKLQAALKEAQLYAKEAPARPLLDIAFDGAQTGYTVGAFGLAFRTRDGGGSWEPIIDRLDNPNGYHLYAIAVHGGDVFIAGELGTLLKLDRAQDRFVKVAAPYEGTFFTLVSSAKALLAAGLRGNAFRSEDGGASWQRAGFSGAEPGTFSSGTAVGSAGIVVTTQSGQIFRSDDGGSAFKLLRAQSPMAYSAVVDAGAGGLLVAGSQGIRRQALS